MIEAQLGIEHYDRVQAVHASPGWLKRLAPVLFFEAYLTISVLTFAFGPWKWDVGNAPELYTFLQCVHLAFGLGYVWGVKNEPSRYNGLVRPVGALKLSIVCTLALYLPTLLWLTGGAINPTVALQDPAIAYRHFQDNVVGEDQGTLLISYVRTLLAPVLFLLMPLLARTWTTIGWRLRLIGVAAILSNLSLWVFTGRNRGLMEFVLVLPWLWLLLPRPNRPARLRWLLVAGVVASVAVTSFSVFYTRNITGRTEEGTDPYWVRLLGGMEADPENILLRPLPEAWRPTAAGLLLNQTHGYYALSLAMEKDFTPAWGVGHSYVLQELEYRLTGKTVLRDRSYPARLEIEDGWSYTEFWHTLYTWLASDITFWGVIPAIFLIGWLFARTWLDSLRGENPFALGLFLLVLTLIYNLPATNIVFGQPEGFAGFWGLTLIWLMTQKRGQAPDRRSSFLSTVPGAQSLRMYSG